MSVAWTLAINGLLGLAAWWASAWFEPRSDRVGRIWVAGVLAATWVVIGTQLLGTIGWLAPGPILGWVAVAIGFAVYLRGSRLDSGTPPPAPVRVEATLSRLAAWFALGITLGVALFLGVNSVVYPVKVVSDGPIYHLYFAARWWKAAQIFLVPVPFGESAAPYFPANGDLWFTWLMVGWGGDRLARIGQAPALLACGWLATQLGIILGASKSSSIVAACWFVTILPLLLFSFEGNVDTLFAAAYLAGIFGLIRHDLGLGRGRTLVISALALGLAWGCKPTGTVFVAPIVLLVTLVLLRKRRPGAAAAFVVASLGPCLYWFVANTLRTGNPLYPAQLELAGLTFLAGWYGPEAMKQSPYFLPGSDLAAFWDILIAVLDPRLLPFWALSLIALCPLCRRSSTRDRWLCALAMLTVLNLLLFWIAIPYRTQQRFMLHSFGLAAAPLALLFDRPIRAALSALILAAHLFTYPSWPFLPAGDRPPWTLNSQIPQPSAPIYPIFSALGANGPTLARVLPYYAAMLAAGLILAALWVSPPRKGPLRLLAPAATVLVVLAAIAWQDHAYGALRRIFPDFEYLPAWYVVESVSPERGLTIAYAGTDIPYYLLGGRLRNDVRYVNVDAHNDWLLHDYHRDAVRRGAPSNWPDPRPGWDRMQPDAEAWLANLDRQGVRLLVVARADPARGRLNVHDAESFPIERSWADARPAIFSILHADPRIRVYAVHPGGIPTDPDPARH